MPVRVSHLTSVHPRYDTRIFLKECHSLANAGCEVSLVVADGQGDEVRDAISIFDVGASKGRVQRILKTTKLVFERAKILDADIYHFHDPELLPVGLLLKLHRKQVVYDAHEDLPRQIPNKAWIPIWLRDIVSNIIEIIEAASARMLDNIVAATPTIAKRFPAEKTVTIQNYPILEELAPANLCPYTERHPLVAYVGGISEIRGIKEMIQAMALLPESPDIRLVLAGSFSPPKLEAELKQMPGWERVEFLGWQSRDGVVRLLSQVRIGLVLLHPTQNYLDSYPIKLFEYMAAGIPVVASDFPLWKRIVEGSNCGLCVNPMSPASIAEAIQHLIDKPDEAKKMGENGLKAIDDKYNWSGEKSKLLSLYEQLALIQAGKSDTKQ